MPPGIRIQAERAIGISDKTLLMMNRSEFDYREADCSQTLLLTNGGEKQRIVFFEEAALDSAHPYLREWLSQGQPVAWQAAAKHYYRARNCTAIGRPRRRPHHHRAAFLRARS